MELDPRKAGIALTVVAAASLALSGCAAAEQDPAAAASAAASEAGPVEPPVEVVTQRVEPSETGGLKDRGLEIGRRVPDFLHDRVDTKAVNAAHAEADRIPNPTIAAQVHRYIGARLARSTLYPDFYTFADTPDLVESNKKEIGLHESAIDAVRDEEIKTAGERALDAQEAEAAAEAAEHPAVAGVLLASVEDSHMKQLAEAVIGGNEEARLELDKLDTDARQALEQLHGSAYGELYNGSNSDAEQINAQIGAFNKARELAGN